jgi:hypothetical protein
MKIPAHIASLAFCLLASFALSIPARSQPISAGRSFAVCFMDNEDLDKPGALFRLFISGDRSTNGTIRYGDSVRPFTIEAGTITTIDVPLSLVVATPGIIERKGILIDVADTVIIYGLNHATATSDAFLALPVSPLDTDYRAMSWPSRIDNPYKADGPPSEFAVVGIYDNTDVTITPAGHIWNDQHDITLRVRLNRGETYLVKSGTFRPDDLTGSHIVSSHPVAVFSGHKRAIVPQRGYEPQTHDHLVEQMPPVSRWDSSAFVTPHPSPSKPAGDRNMFRVLAAYDSTIIRIDGIDRATLPAGGFLQDTLRGAHVITANLPILAAEFEMSAVKAELNEGRDPIGDPFMILAPSVGQYLPAYSFVSIPLNAFTLHYVTITIPDTATGSIIFDGAPLPDTVQFLPIGASGYSYGIVRVGEGTHAIHSMTGTSFGLVAYGYGPIDSYGYIAGQKLERLIDRFDRMPPYLSSLAAQCGERTISFSDTGTIISGFSPTSVETILKNTAVAGIGFSHDSSTIAVTVTTIDDSRDGTFTLTVRDRNGHAIRYNETIPGTRITAAKLQQNGAETAFRLADGRTMFCDTMAIINAGSVGVVASISLANNTRFSISPGPLPLQIPAGQRGTVALCIDGNGIDEATDTLTITDTCGHVTRYPLRVTIEPQQFSTSDRCGDSLTIGTGAGRGEGVLKASPNPTGHEELSLVFRSTAPGSRIQIINTNGQIIRSYELKETTDLQQLPVSLAGIPAGVYSARVIAGNHVEPQTIRFVVIK